MQRKYLAMTVALGLLGASGGLARAAPPAPEVVNLWPGVPPGTEDWSGAETTTVLPVPGSVEVRMVGNVTRPTLTVYRPQPGMANGTAVVVVPGGGFQTLAIVHEGDLVARWLADRGVTAFLLKYRVRTIPGFRIPGNLRKNPELFKEFAASFSSGRPIAIADATQTMRYLRTNADRLGIASDRIGMIGFSAGAITTMGVVMSDIPADRPNFAAPIYGAMEDKAPPNDGPPLFIAVTQDDNAVPALESMAIFTRWTAAQLPAELHVYEKGGHGFGMRPLSLPVDGWTKAFETWLGSHGWLGKAAPSKPAQP